MKPLISLNFSDSHLGNPRLDPEVMCNNLYEFIAPYISKVKLLSIVGDLYDGPIGYGDSSSKYITLFVVSLLKLCHDHNVAVRILRGTYSHDRRQIENIPVIHKAAQFTNDLRYVDKLSLEYIEQFDMRVLYVPDNLPHDSSDAVIREVKKMMTDLGWDTVDYAYVHGYFAHVVPEAARQSIKIIFSEEQFDFVNSVVVTGHVHPHSRNGRVVYIGSTDRLAHNEEEPKGMLLIDDRVSSQDITFIENKKASIFRTFDYSEFTILDNVVDKFAEELKQYTADQQLYIRVIHPTSEIRGALGAYLKEHFPLVRYAHTSGVKINKEVANQEILIPLDDDRPSTPLTEENLAVLLRENMLKRGVVDVPTPGDIDTYLVGLDGD